MLLLFCFVAPDPAANLSINVRGGKSAIVSWNPPALGHYSGFKMKVLYLKIVIKFKDSEPTIYYSKLHSRCAETNTIVAILIIFSWKKSSPQCTAW